MRDFIHELWLRLLRRHTVEAIVAPQAKIVEHLKALSERRQSQALRHMRASMYHDRMEHARRDQATEADRRAVKLAEVFG